MTIREVSTLACWLAILASFVLSFSTWLALAELAGFGWLALAMPACVDGYIVTALATWLTPEVSERLARFARGNLYAVGMASVLAQASYHGGIVVGQAGWRVALAIAAGGLPPAVAVLAVHIKARMVRELASAGAERSERAVAAQPAPSGPAPQVDIPSQLPWLEVTDGLDEMLTQGRSEGLHNVATAMARSPEAERELSASLGGDAVRGVQAESTVAPEGTARSGSAELAIGAESSIIEPPSAPTAAEQPASRVAATRQSRPPRKVEQSGSGPRPKVTGAADVRALVDAGLSHREVAARLGVSTRTATRRIADARAESGPLVAVS